MEQPNLEPLLYVIGIDPGTNCCGFAIFSIGLHTHTVSLVEAHTVKRGPLLKGHDSEVELSDERFVVIKEYAKHLMGLLETYNPILVGSEGPYLGSFAQTFAALREMLIAFKATVYKFCRVVPFNVQAPSIIKTHMGVKGTSGDKTAMTSALKARKDITYPCEGYIDTLDEHSVDAGCVGLYTVDRALKLLRGVL